MTVNEIASEFARLALTHGADELYLDGMPVRIEVRTRLDGQVVVAFYAGDTLVLAVATGGD